MNELKNRGVQDVLIAVVDGLKGFPEAITAAFPDAMVQSVAPPVHGWIGPPIPGRPSPCIVHLVRYSGMTARDTVPALWCALGRRQGRTARGPLTGPRAVAM